MHYFISILLLCLHYAHSATPDRLAVLSIQNTTGTESSFVEAMPDMIVSDLLRVAPDLQLVERGQVEAAIKELQLDIGGLTEEGSRRIGQWVGAERILIGTLSSLGTSVRLDLRIIQVESGRILQAGNATVESNDLQRLIPLTVQSLQKPPTPARTTLPPIPASVTASPARMIPDPEPVGNASLRIRYRAVLSLFTQKAVPMQRVRIYCNGVLLGESAILDAVNKDFTIYSGSIPAGEVELRLEHGVVSKSGDWKGLFTEQPPTRALWTRKGDRVELDYKLKVGNTGFHFSSLKS